MISVKCKKHQKYKALKPPKGKLEPCSACKHLWIAFSGRCQYTDSELVIVR